MHRATRVALVVGLIIALLLIAAGGYVWLITLSDKRIESRLTALRQAGEPTSVEELWRSTGTGSEKPQDTRFAEVVAQASEIRKIVENSYAPALMDENGHLTEAGRQRISEAFQKHGKFLDLVAQFLENPPAPVSPASEPTPEDHLKWCVRACCPGRGSRCEDASLLGAVPWRIRKHTRGPSSSAIFTKIGPVDSRVSRNHAL